MKEFSAIAVYDYVKATNYTTSDIGMVRLELARIMYDKAVYRVAFDPGTSYVDVFSIGIDSVDSSLCGKYKSQEALPEWMRDRLAVLNIMSAKPPTTEVEGVGRRIDANVFWVYAEKEN